MAVGAVGAMITSGLPHAILLSGPGGAGKTTLALDLAAALLCTADPSARPCRDCRSCRMVDHGNHPDVHRLGPEGPGGQIRIGGRSGEPRGIRDLAADLALLPVEGGARVAIIEQAQRMNEDAQSALLKTLEEPPTGVVLVLCADEEERLLPTVRSRCARIRLGPVGVRAIEELLADRGVADPPLAARLARLAGGRPGVALAYATAPEAVTARAEIARALLDLVPARAAARLDAARELLGRSGDAARAFDAAASGGVARTAFPPGRRGRRRTGEVPPPETVSEPPPATADPADSAASEALAAGVRLAPSERRRAVAFLVETWRDLARDLALVQLGNHRSLLDPTLLEELAPVADGLAREEIAEFLVRLARASELIEANVSPELLLDGLVLAWPRRQAAA